LFNHSQVSRRRRPRYRRRPLDVPSGRGTSNAAPSGAQPPTVPAANTSAADIHNLHFLPRLRLHIGKSEVDALLDSGATHTFIRNGTIDVPVETLSEPFHLLTVTTQPGNHIIGTQTLRCRAGGWSGNITFLVVDGLREQIICGYDFLRDHQAIMDTTRRCLYLGNGEKRATIHYLAGPDLLVPRAHVPPQALRPDQVDHGFPDSHVHGLRQLLDEFSSIFNDQPSPSTTPTVRHTIRLKDDSTFRIRPYRYSDEKKTTIYQQIEKMLADRIIEPSTSEFASPIVVVKKKDGQPRFCVDYRRLNSQTVDEATPLPRIHEQSETSAKRRYSPPLTSAPGTGRCQWRRQARSIPLSQHRTAPSSNFR
jgi:hypothetical protein